MIRKFLTVFLLLLLVSLTFLTSGINNQASASIRAINCNDVCSLAQCGEKKGDEYCVSAFNMVTKENYYCWTTFTKDADCPTPTTTPKPTATTTPKPTATTTPGPSEDKSELKGKIVFSSNKAGSYEIYTMNADGTNIKQITDAPKTDWMPSFSPDGKKIVFLSYRDGDSEIYTINTNGTNPVRLTNTNINEGSPSFSPDGKQIIYDFYRPKSENTSQIWRIMIMNSDGTNPRPLTPEDELALNPSFSPDGQKIAFRKHNYDNHSTDIYIMDSDGSNMTQLTSDPNEEYYPSFSPDGKTIVYSLVNKENNISSLYLINLETKAVSKLTSNTIENNKYASFSPDGNKIIFSRLLEDSYKGISVINKDGSNLINLTENDYHTGFNRVWISQNDDDTGTPIPAITQPENCPMKSLGDANCDGVINLQDLIVWTCQVFGLGNNCDSIDRAADFDLINNVNINDFEIWRQNFYTVPHDTVAPKPTKPYATIAPDITTAMGPVCDYCSGKCTLRTIDTDLKTCTTAPIGSTCVYDESIDDCKLQIGITE